jgi:hypothetical protein
MNKRIGAELTALSAPGGFFGYGGSPFNQTFYGNGVGYGSPYAPLYGSSFRPYGGPPPGYGVQVGPYILGADAPVAPSAPVQRTGLVADLAPILAPATGGISLKTFLDDQYVLHVEICVDGTCHQTSMDVAPAIRMVMQKLASWHQAQHAQATPDKVVEAVGRAVGEAQKLIVGALVTRHINTVSGSWLGDIKSGLTKVVNTTLKLDVFGIHNVASGIVKKFKGPITVAATAIATAYGGPLAGAAAAKLVGPIIDQTAEFGKKKNPAVAQAEEAAKTDPVAAQALKSAQDAVAQAIAAQHVKDLTQKAAAGDLAAKQQLAQTATAAQNGDPAAKAVADLAASAMNSEWGANLWTSLTGRGPDTVSGQWYDIVGRAHR